MTKEDPTQVCLGQQLKLSPETNQSTRWTLSSAFTPNGPVRFILSRCNLSLNSTVSNSVFSLSEQTSSVFAGDEPLWSRIQFVEPCSISAKAAKRKVILMFWCSTKIIMNRIPWVHMSFCSPTATIYSANTYPMLNEVMDTRPSRKENHRCHSSSFSRNGRIVHRQYDYLYYHVVIPAEIRL